MIIDFHVHLGRRANILPATAGFCDGFWKGRGDWDAVVADADALDAHLAAEGVDFAVGLPEVNPLVTGVTTNEEVFERFGRAERVLLFANLNPWIHRDLPGEVRRLASLGFRGLKMYPTYQDFYPNERRLYPLYAACAEARWPVMFHTGSSIFPGSRLKYGDPLWLDDVAVDFPALDVLIVHGGRGLWYERAEFLAQLHPNLYLEISGLPPKNLLRYFPNLERIGHKVVFGSDWPANPGIAKNIGDITELGLPGEVADAILGETAARLLGLGG